MMNSEFRFKKSVNLWLFNFEKINATAKDNFITQCL